MYFLVKVTTDNKVTLIPCPNRTLPLRILQSEVDGMIEIVRLPRLLDLAMVINDNGYNLRLPFNTVGSGLYGDPNHVILGDVVLGTFYNPDPEAEPDVYAFDFVTALRVKSMMQDLLSEYKKNGLI